ENDPPSAPANQMQIVDPATGIDPRARGVLEDVENAHLRLLVGGRGSRASPCPCTPDELCGAHVADPGIAQTIGIHDPLRQLGVYGLRHPITVGRVPSLDVVESRATD